MHSAKPRSLCWSVEVGAEVDIVAHVDVQLWPLAPLGFGVWVLDLADIVNFVAASPHQDLPNLVVWRDRRSKVERRKRY